MDRDRQRQIDRDSQPHTEMQRQADIDRHTVRDSTVELFSVLLHTSI